MPLLVGLFSMWALQQQLDLSCCGIRGDCLSRFSDWFWFDPSSLIPLINMIWSILYLVICWGKKASIEAHFPFFSSPGLCGWSKPSIGSTDRMVVASQGFYFLFWRCLLRMIKEGFQPAFSVLTSNGHYSDLLKMPKVYCSYLSWQLVWLETLLLLDFSRCLSWLQGLSQRVERHPFSLKPWSRLW